MSKKRHISELSAIVFIIIGAVIISISLIFTGIDIDFMNIHLSLGEFGEFIGGFVGSIWALAGVLLFYSALVNQRRELDEQQQQITKQTNAMIKQTKELEIQNKTLSLQKQEETFFELLNFHTDMIKSIEMQSHDIDMDSGNVIRKTVTGRRTFHEFYLIYKRFYHKYLEHLSDAGVDEQNLQDVVEISYNSFFGEYRSEIGHYFRNIFNIMTFIDRVEEDNKVFYLSVFHSQVSAYEFAMIFFHGLTRENVELKVLIEKYAFLQNMPNDELITLNKELYNEGAYKNPQYDFTHDLD